MKLILLGKLCLPFLLILPLHIYSQTLPPTSYYTLSDSTSLNYVLFEMGYDSTTIYGMAVETQGKKSWLTAFSASGFEEQWSREFYLTNNKPDYVAQASDGSIYIGLKLLVDGKTIGVYVAKLDADGDIIWEKRLTFPNDHLIDASIAMENHVVYVGALLDSTKSKFTTDYTTVLKLGPSGDISLAKTFHLASNSLSGNIELKTINNQVVLATEDEIILMNDSLNKAWHVYGAHQPSPGKVQITKSEILAVNQDIYMYFYLFSTAEGHYEGSNIFFKMGLDGQDIKTGQFDITHKGQYYRLTADYSSTDNLISIFGRSYSDDMWEYDERSYHLTLNSNDLSLQSKYLFQDSCEISCRLNSFYEILMVGEETVLSSNYEWTHSISMFEAASDVCFLSPVQDSGIISYTLNYPSIDWFTIDTLGGTNVPSANYPVQNVTVATWASLVSEEYCPALGIPDHPSSSLLVSANTVYIGDPNLLPLNLTLYSLDGKIVYRKVISEMTQEIQTDITGLYLATFHNGKGFREHHKVFIVN